MKATTNSKHSLIRNRIFLNILFISIGIYFAYFYWPEDYAIEKIEDWKSFASIMGSVSATMVGFLVAVGALLYTVSNTPLLSYLRKKGVERRIIFDLFAATSFWLICLFFSIFATFPKANISPVTSGMVSYIFAICGLLSFLPIGYSLWMVLSNIDAKPGRKKTLPSNENPDFWTTPTEID